MKQKNNINIENLIELASFNLKEDEKKMLEKEIEDFLGYASVINNAPCDDIKPASHAVDRDAFMRQDQIDAWEKVENILANSPALDGKSYLVPPQKTTVAMLDEEKEESEKAYDGDLDVVIGLEVHARLKTKSKIFCNCSTQFGDDPNSNACPVCSGQPGVLPVLNKEAVNMAIVAGLAAGCKINKHSVFARKNYFYPDLPKGYQISQFEEPICSGGGIEIEIDGKVKKVRLNRIHMEEDAGKMVHVGAPGIWGAKASAVDFNRCSVPLVEIVTEPDLSSAEEAREFVTMLRAVLVSLGICDGNMEEGSLKCDANVSVKPAGSKKLGVKVEIKNMNSFKAIERALEFEIVRLKKMKQNGIRIKQETRGWDESGQKTYSMRGKEESQDYRYFPDPDLLPIVLTDEWIDSLKDRISESPLSRKKKCIDNYSFSENEARLFMVNPSYNEYFEKVLKHYDNPRTLANWFFSEILSQISGDLESIHILPEDFAGFLKKIDKGEISGRIGKDIIKKAFTEKKGLLEIIEKEGIKQESDPAVIEKIIDDVLKNNAAQVADYRSGKEKLYSFFIGQIMKLTKGKADPALVNEILKNKLKS